MIKPKKKMNKEEDCINYWKDMLEIKEWDITTKGINPKSVTYDSDCSAEDRYCVGVLADRDTKTATIYHDRELTERDIIHELLHVRYPKWIEDHVNEVEELLYKINKDE